MAQLLNQGKTIVRPESISKKPLFLSEVKDVCVVHDGRYWHMYGTHCVSSTGWKIHKAVSKSLGSGWEIEPPIDIPAKGGCMTAPSVIFDHGIFHMFIQTDCFSLGGEIIHLVSSDGRRFQPVRVALRSCDDEPGLYDGDATVIGGRKLMAYTVMSRIGHGDIHLAEFGANNWFGVLGSRGKVLSHEDICMHHNQHDHPDYEWGIEGAQIMELPSGLILMNAVCFLPQGERGTRQRIFFAVASRPEGPYVSMGPVIEPTATGWDSGENGHGYAVLRDRKVHLFYQARPKGGRWSCGHATFNVKDIEMAASSLLPP